MNGGEATALGISQAVTLWVALVPPLSEAREATAASDTDFMRTFRHGEFVAGIAALSVGVVASSLSHSAMPLIIASLAVAVLAALYEYTLAMPGRTANLYVLDSIRIGDNPA